MTVNDCKTLTERKRYSIIKAASGLFLDKGYGSVSMDEVAAKADVSKRTVYNHFPSKAVLFADVVRMTWCGLKVPVLDVNSDRSIEESLYDFITESLVLLRSEKFTKLLRLVMGESGKFPELTEMYSENGIKPLIFTLESYIRAKSEKGELKIEDPLLATLQFIGMVKEVLFWPVLLGVLPKPAPEKEKKVIDSSISIFMKVYS